MALIPADLAVINDALVRIGATPIAATNDAQAQAIAAEQVYAGVVANLLAMHPWSFALRQKRINQIVVPEVNRLWADYTYVYQLPTDAARVLGIRDGSGYQIAGDQLYTDCNEVFLVYVAQPGVATWPPYFRQAVVFDFAAAVAITVTDTASRAQLYADLGERQKMRAMSIDAQSVPPWVFDLMRIYTRITVNPLTS